VKFEVEVVAVAEHDSFRQHPRGSQDAGAGETVDLTVELHPSTAHVDGPGLFACEALVPGDCRGGHDAAFSPSSFTGGWVVVELCDEGWVVHLVNLVTAIR
jgi:hypothetical protein